MITIDYTYTNYPDLFRLFAKKLKLKIKDNTAYFPEDKGAGKIKLLNLPNQLQIIICDFTYDQEILFQRKKADTDFYILRINYVAAKEDASGSSVFLGKTSASFHYMTSASKPIFNMDVIIPAAWLENFFSKDELSEILVKNTFHKTAVHYYDFFDPEYKRLLNEIIQTPENGNFELMVIQNRISLILERFFTRLYKKLSDTTVFIKASSDELGRVREVEAELLKDFSYQPPNINALARKAAMSTSKLKNLFKEVYGLPVYQYFQKQRMNKAKAMLISRKYSIKQVTEELGYNAVNEFSRAFQKMFDQTPNDIA